MVQRQQAMSMRRQSSAPGTLRKQGNARSSFVSCAMGDEDENSLSSISTRQSSFSSLASSERRSSILPSTICGNTTTAKSFSFQNHNPYVKPPKWVLGVLCIFTAFSWIQAVQYRTTTYDILSAMDSEYEAFVSKKEQSSRLLDETTGTMMSFIKEKVKLKKTKRLFQHENRMLEEMAEMEALSASDNAEIPQEALENFKNRRSGNVAKKWIGHRQDAILHKVYNLQAYIQEQSRKRIIEKYGDGPHQVVFHVKSREGRKPGRFTVRMAPLSTVPHSIETFLDQVSNKIWDDTILYSHGTQDHVVAAAPITYRTFESKEHEMATLGFTGVSFPEYSWKYPHKKYTLGFVGSSSINFFINAVDNTDHHGPGAQQHHELEGDADPCFGEIIEGFGVLQDMQYGRHTGIPNGWEDFDLTRIMSAEVVPWP